MHAAAGIFRARQEHVLRSGYGWEIHHACGRDESVARLPFVGKCGDGDQGQDE